MTDSLPAVPAPSDHEWDMLVATADRIARTQMVPQAFRNKPDDILAAALYGREIGLGPMASLQRIIVINGKPTLDAQGMAAVIRRAGHSITGTTGDTSATAIGRRADNGDEMKVTWTIAMAQQAGLVKSGPWKQYPAAMLWARAVTQLARELFPDVLSGFSYTPEEMGDVASAAAPEPPKVEQVADEAVDVEEDDEPAPAFGPQLAKVKSLWEQLPEAGRPDLDMTLGYAGKSAENARKTIARLEEIIAAAEEEAVDAEVVELHPKVADRVEIDWKDVEDRMLQDGVSENDAIAEIRKRKALMRNVHTVLGKRMDDDAKDMLLRGQLQVGSWKLVPSDTLKDLIAQYGGDAS